MIKRIAIILLAITILVTGYISLKKLNYWDRTVMIFKVNTTEQSFGGRDRRGSGEFEGREGFQRPDRRNIPDSLRGRYEGRGQRNFTNNRNSSDSISALRMQRDARFNSQEGFGGRMRGEDGQNSKNLRRVNTINLNRVIYYIAVFAFFTLIMIFAEKCYTKIFSRKIGTSKNSDFII